MFNVHNKFGFVTICFWLNLLGLLARCDVYALSIQKTHTHDNDIVRGELSINGNSNANDNDNARQPDATVLNFSPRLEYNNEWRPVGRGDPLKNDPTYDYSPPALERVRYWRAENESKDETNNPKYHKKENSFNGKNELLLLGLTNERQRGQSIHSEMSVVQPKYTSIRRSYYAHHHQLPTHLMPPPMQTLTPPNNSMKTSVASEYRHNIPSSATTTTTTMSMMHSKPYYSTSATSPWMQSSFSPSISSSPASLMQNYRQSQSSLPFTMNDHHDHHHQESINQFTYTRPSLGSPFKVNNIIESNKNSVHTRKPWLHELLQKEVVKVPPKNAFHKYATNYEHMLSPTVGISSTHPPIAFVPLPTTTPPTTTRTTTIRTAATTTPQTTTATSSPIYTTTSPVYFTTTVATSAATPNIPFVSSQATPTPNRLLIPTTSNLIHRPTVTPMEMTTDALFKHYKQPAKPLLGPMYLIIEGHSKVKTYGKDELDPHRPKIVPIIPKREPVVRVADPNEKRGTLETFQVKHLHTKVTAPLNQATESTTTTPTTTAKTITMSSTSASKAPTTSQPSKASATTDSTTKAITTTTTTATNSSTPQATNQNTGLPASNPGSDVMQGFFNLLDSSLGSLFQEDPTAPEIEIDNAFKRPQQEQIIATTTPSATILHPVTTTTTTTPSTMKPKPSEIEARIGTQGGSIESLIDFEDENGNGDKITTEPVPRDVRQVFDYDQLPESRLKDRMNEDADEDEDNEADADASEEGVIQLHDDSVEDIDMEDVESLTHDEYEDENHELIKRIDKLVDDIDDDDDDDDDNDGDGKSELEELMSTEVDSDDDLEMRHTKQA